MTFYIASIDVVRPISWSAHAEYKYTEKQSLFCTFLKAQMPDHHLLSGLFSHGGREKYPPAALNWVLAVPNLIHTYKSYWEGIWGTDKEYNTQAEWLTLLEKEYCKSVQQKTYKVTLEILLKILKRAANNKASARDLIVMY